jgi:dihydrofolate synthase/folylpolyglutamate synthase
MIDPTLLQWLDNHIDLEKNQRLEKPTLERMIKLCKYLGDPQDDVPVIHITGTNGKTSTTRVAETLLRTKGLYTGMFLSPHLSRINERISLDSHAINNELLEHSLNIIRHVEESIDDVREDAPSYFEIFVAAAFSAMNQEAVDVGVIEVGMGGLFDATNVCHSSLSVLTNVELDHMKFLGSTREEIATEKAGIIKENNRVVIGEPDNAIQKIWITHAQDKNAQTFLIDEDFALLSNEQAVGGRLISFRTPFATYEDVFLSLYGVHQANNVMMAAVAAECFIDDALGADVVLEACANVKSPGRMEIVHRDPLVLIDGAHNVAGASALKRSLDEEFSSSRRIWVFGLTNEKDADAMINSLGIENDEVVIVAAAESARAMDVGILGEALRKNGIETVIEAPSARDAIDNALSIALDDDQIVVCGSLYLVGEVRHILTAE